MFHVCLYYTVLSAPCSFVITGWKRADILTLLCMILPCIFVTFPHGVLSQVWQLIILIPDLCLLLYKYSPNILLTRHYVLAGLVRLRMLTIYFLFDNYTMDFEHNFVKSITQYSNLNLNVKDFQHTATQLCL